MICKNCGNNIDSDSKFCKYCGIKLSKKIKNNLINCDECGYAIIGGSEFCSQCGKKIN